MRPVHNPDYALALLEHSLAEIGHDPRTSGGMSPTLLGLLAYVRKNILTDPGRAMLLLTELIGSAERDVRVGQARETDLLRRIDELTETSAHLADARAPTPAPRPLELARAA